MNLSAPTEKLSAEACRITEKALRHSLASIKQAPLDPVQGLFGPGSTYWEINRHTIPYFLGAVQAVQMQLVHPWIATAVFEHSKIMTNPRARAQLTYIYLWSIIYGDLDMVTQKSLSLFKVHGHVEGTIAEDAGRNKAGTPYSANEANALLWVHVTAFYTRVRFYELLIRKLSPGEKDRFVGEATLYARCFGIPAAMHPTSWAEVEAYIAAMQASDILASTKAGLTISRFLRNSIPLPVRSTLWALVCAFVPARSRTLLELPEDNRLNRTRIRAMTFVLRLVHRLLPASLANVPAYSEALGRISGRKKPRWIITRLNKLLLGVPKLVS